MRTISKKENPSPPQPSSTPFFNKKEESSFITKTGDTNTSFFSPNPIQKKSATPDNINRPSSFHNTNNFIQTKLKINEPNDAYEKEADIVSEQIVKMKDFTIGNGDEIKQPKSININSIQRKCSTCEGEEAQLEERKESETIQKKSLINKNTESGNRASNGLSSKLKNSKGNGKPLPENTLNSMNSAFGTDFSSVRIHNDAKAEEMSEGIQANAFTHGSDIYFNKQQYNPETREGEKLLAHELTHTIQQNKSSMIQRQPKAAPPEKTSETLEYSYRKLRRYKEADAIANCRKGIDCEILITRNEIESKFNEVIKTEPVMVSTSDKSTVDEVVEFIVKEGIKLALKRFPIGIIFKALASDLIDEILISKKAKYLEDKGYIVLENDSLAICIEGCHSSDTQIPSKRDLFDDAQTPSILKPHPDIPFPKDYFKQPLLPEPINPPGPNPIILPPTKPEPKEPTEKKQLDDKRKAQERLAEEIRNKLVDKVYEANAKGESNLPSRVPYQYLASNGTDWMINIFVNHDTKPSFAIKLNLTKYVAGKEAYIIELLDFIRKKIANLPKTDKKEDKPGSDTKDKPDDKSKGDKKDDFVKDKTVKDEGCDGAIECGYEALKKVVEKGAEFLDLTDLKDIPEMIMALPEVVTLIEQTESFGRFASHLSEFEGWITNPKNLIQSLIGGESSSLLDSLGSWVNEETKIIPFEKGNELNNIARTISSLVSKIKAILKPIFEIRNRIHSMLKDVKDYIKQVPSNGTVKYLLELSRNPEEFKILKDDMSIDLKSLLENTLQNFTSEISLKLKVKLHEILQLLSIPDVKFLDGDFFSTKRISSAITKLITNLVSKAAKALGKFSGKIVGEIMDLEIVKGLISDMVGKFVKGTTSKIFKALNSNLNIYNKLFESKIEGTLKAFETEISTLIITKFNDLITSAEDVKVARSAKDNRLKEDNASLNFLPEMLKKSTGSPIEPTPLSKMESAINSDFKQVKIHTDQTAETASNMLHANAFVIGSDIYFGKGKYNPNSHEGQKLLAHELTHVEQQKNGVVNGTIQRSKYDGFVNTVFDALTETNAPLPETGLIDQKTGRKNRQTDRDVLRTRMSAPKWADPKLDYGGWNAHHIIPWEFVFHSVFDILRANGGWDHNDPDKNGIALPMGKIRINKGKKEIYRFVDDKDANLLPIHQSTTGLTRGHPVYNINVLLKLDALLNSYENDPVTLRSEVLKLIDNLKSNELVASRRNVLF